MGRRARRLALKETITPFLSRYLTGATRKFPINTALTVETDLQNCDDYRRDADALVAAPFRAAGLLVCRPHRDTKAEEKDEENKRNLVHIGYFLTNCSVGCTQENYKKNKPYNLDGLRFRRIASLFRRPFPFLREPRALPLPTR